MNYNLIFFSAGGLIVFFIRSSIPVYQKFTHNPEKFKGLGFLFCFDEEQMHTKYGLSKQRSKTQIRMQDIYYKITSMIQRVVFTNYTIYFTYMFYKNFKVNYFDYHIFNDLLLASKIICYILFLTIYSSMATRFLVNFMETLLTIKYLTYRLADLRDEILSLFSKKIYLNNRHFNQRVSIIVKNYCSIIKDKYRFNKHINESLIWTPNLLIFSVAYPSVVIFESNKTIVFILFNCFNYMSIMNLFSILVVHNSMFLNLVS